MDRNSKIAFGALTVGLIYIAYEHFELAKTYNRAIAGIEELHADTVREAQQVLQIVHDDQFQQIIENLDED